MKKLAVLALLPLSACISFGSEPPASLLAIRADQTPSEGATLSSADARAVTIAVPEVSSELATPRIPVRTGATQVAYVKDARWVEQPNRMFARLLAQTVTARSGMVVLSSRQSLEMPSASLTGELLSFGVDAGTRDAVVAFEASFAPRGGGFEKRLFEARVPVTAIESNPVAEALNVAANRVAGEVADWLAQPR